MKVTIKFQSVEDGLPPLEPTPAHGLRFSIPCMASVGDEIYDGAVLYSFTDSGWVRADMAFGHTPDDYQHELGGNNPTVTAWAPWPVLVPLEVAACA